ncbi:MAG: hypothetical protein K2X77_21070 [Candidatus Obscuribacterales bacterium]|nr:hypothetical protein [Candidatus Obscuribacterales bacterium]
MTTIFGQAQARSQTKSGSTKFARHDHYPQGWQEIAAQFLNLFHRYGYIYKPLPDGTWFSADEKWKLTDSEILKAVAGVHPKFILGSRAGKTTRFAVIDIDNGSKYHNRTYLEKLLQLLANAGLERNALYRSSYSGGWHLYLFFEEPINSADLRKQLLKLLVLNDFLVAKGQLEIFPHPGSNGSQGLGLRLPLQPGFAWLDKRTLDIDLERHEVSATKALELFIDVLDSDANPYAAFKQLKEYIRALELRREAATIIGASRVPDNVVSIRREQRDGEGDHITFVQAVFHKLPPGIIADNWYKGRLYHLNGLTAPSQRAECIECVGHYFFYGDPSRDLPALGYGYEQEREWAIREFLSAHHNGQSKDINRGRADAMAQVQRATNWRPAHRPAGDSAKYRPQRPVSWIRENVNRKRDARTRIAGALGEIKKRQRSFSTVELQQAAGCSRTTLYKHADIWRQDYEDLAEDFFAICTHEYNVVVGAGSSETEPPSTSLQLNMPLERLAARQIASELAMRNQRGEKRARKVIQKALDASEKDWQDKVRALAKAAAVEPDFKKLKAFIVMLVSYLSTAPNEELQSELQVCLRSLKEKASNSALELVPETRRPPPS